MPDPRPLPLWAGRTLALLGILLVALNLRTAVASLSPITDDIAADIEVSAVAFGVLGALPPIAFALSGLLAPLLAKKIGLDASLALASAAIVLGTILRGFAGSYLALLLGSVVVLAGMGFGNILLPPAVKRYFPDRIGLVTTAYVTLLSVSTAVPAVLAAPVADAAGWRVSLGLWALLGLAALLPWLLLVVRDRSSRAASGTPQVDEPEPAIFGKLLRSRVAWGITLAFSSSALNAYAMFAWLPTLLLDTTDIDRVGAGVMLAVYGIVGLPAALVVPILAARMRNVGVLVQLGVACFLAGYLGLLLAPGAATLLWVVLAGLGPILFPVSLVLINLRTRSHHSSIALSGFVQSVGYSVGALGPLVVGVLHDLSGGWTAPLLLLLGTLVMAAVSGLLVARPRFVEDDFADKRN